MKNTRLFLLIVLLLFLSMGLTACGGSEEEVAEPEAPAAQSSETEAEASQPETAVEEAPAVEEMADEAVAEEPEAAAAEPQEEPVEAEPVEEAEESPAEQASSPVAEILQLDEIDTDEGLENYEMNLTMNFTSQDENGNDVIQTITADIVSGSNPDALSMNMSMEGVEGAEEFGSMMMVQLEDTNYMVIPELGCITSPVEDAAENPFADLADSDQILEGVSGAQFEGEETINGTETLHYTFDASNLTEEEAQDVEWVDGHVYLAKEGGYLVRFVMEGEGALDQFATGEDQFGMMRLEYDITPIDTAVTVEIPAECAESGAENSPYPILDDASEYSSFGGLISYMTATTIDEALAFYDEALAADGWVKDESGMYLEGSMANFQYTKDGTTITVMITSDDNEELNSILIIEGE